MTAAVTMPPYPVTCYRKGCAALALYKVAARWSDGVTEELKTYALSCPDCLGVLFREALARRSACRLAPNESLDLPAVFELSRGARDRQLVRLPELEQMLLTVPPE